jgi:hypothetical protein
MLPREYCFASEIAVISHKTAFLEEQPDRSPTVVTRPARA